MLLGLVMGLKSTTCVNSEICGDAPALEHNGDLYSCDHFVQNKYLVGNIMEEKLTDLMNGPQQREFGKSKRDSLPKYCLDCNFLNYCWGGCPKDRICTTYDNEEGLNYLCEGYKRFYSFSEPYLKKIADCINRGYNAKEWKNYNKNKKSNKIKRNSICSCGSGLKFKKCCGSIKNLKLNNVLKYN